MNARRTFHCILLALLLSPVVLSCSSNPKADAEVLTIYSGRNQQLVGPLIERFQQSSGIRVQVRYGDSAEMASTILEEGRNSPADLFFSQDAGALGALRGENRLKKLPEELLARVPRPFRCPDGFWVGTSGRVRVVVFNSGRLSEAEMPDSLSGFTDPKWKGRIGWAPANASFQAFVTAFRLSAGDDAALKWILGIQANQPKVYAGNTAIVEAAGRGEIDVGFTNHYYLHRFLAERGESFSARNYYPRAGGVETLVNVAGAAVLAGTKREGAALDFIAFLLSEEAQRFLVESTFEYPLANHAPVPHGMKPLAEVAPPDFDLSRLGDLQGTLRMLAAAGAL